MSSMHPHDTHADDEALMPSWDVPPDAVPMALPVGMPAEGDLPVALPVAAPVAVAAPPAAPAAPATPATPAAVTCPACQSANPAGQAYCSDCGYYFSAADLAGASSPLAAAVAEPLPRVQGRYELLERVSERLGVERFKARDHGTAPPSDVVVVRQPMPAATVAAAEESPAPVESAPSDEFMPSFDDESFPQTQVISGQPRWPSIAWERKLLASLESAALPTQLDHFIDETHEYLIEDVPPGRLLWDGWDDQDTGASVKYGYLVQVAELLHRLHQCNAMLEGLRPDMVTIDDAGQVRLNSLSELLPLPLPPDAPVRGSLYSAPELMSGSGVADARADLYSFGAMLYSLHVGRELNERTDFDKPGRPKDFIPRFPDSHPAFARLMMKTFRKEPETRFPTDEAGKEDPSGCLELVRVLESLRRTADDVRLEISSWTSTGIVRTGNEDAFAMLHAVESRQDDLGEAALILLCDGMGGYEAGEIAAALTIKTLRESLSKMHPFCVAAGTSPFPGDPLAGTPPGGHAGPATDVEAIKAALKQALRDANRAVFQASRAPGTKRRGMGCTAEAVYIDGRNVIVGHVGDSRTYHLHEGRLVQLTRDQTLVNRLVELGSLSPEEAEHHPRKNELQQAIGGQPDVEPGVYAGKMSAGDWVVVCSDGLTNHVSNKDLAQMLQSEAASADVAARRLVNLTLIEGATDNVTVVVVRGT